MYSEGLKSGNVNHPALLLESQVKVWIVTVSWPSAFRGNSIKVERTKNPINIAFALRYIILKILVTNVTT